MVVRARGANFTLHHSKEATYGTATTWDTLPCYSFDVGATRGLVDNPVLGLSPPREAAAPTQDVLNVGGTAVVPVDVEMFPIWLQMLLGAPTTTDDSGVYTHVFKSGAATIGSATFEKAMLDSGVYHKADGLKANTMDIAYQAGGGVPRATFGLIGRSEARATSTYSSSPSEAAPIFYQASDLRLVDGSEVAVPHCVASKLTFTNNLDPVRTIASGAIIEGVDEGLAMVSGSITVRMSTDTSTMFSAAEAHTPLAFIWRLLRSDTELIGIRLPVVYLERPSVGIQGPQGIEVTFPFKGATNAAGMVEITVTNSVSAY